jgi:hypothetical protein
METQGEKFKRFADKFVQQMAFIEKSCAEYDGGFEDDAIRIATSLRTVFHDTGPKLSTSLVRHLNIGSSRMLSSARGWGDHRDYLSWVIDLNSPTPVTTKPILGKEFREISIQDWWHNEPVFIYNKKTYPRRKIILEAANTDGGAHVAERLTKFYEALADGVNGFSIDGKNLEYSGGPAPFQQDKQQSPKNAHLALIRQFAHEFLNAVNHFDWAKRIEARLAKHNKGI